MILGGHCDGRTRKFTEVEAVAKLLDFHGVSVAAHAGPCGDEADDAVGSRALFAICVDSGVAVALGEAAAVGADDKRQVEVCWERRVVEGAVEEDLSRGGIEEVVASHDVRDALAVIVDDDGELICGLAWNCWVAAGPDDEVPDGLCGVDGLIAGALVEEVDGFVGCDETPCGVRIIEASWNVTEWWTKMCGERGFVRACLRRGLSGHRFEFFARERVGKNCSLCGELLYRAEMMLAVVGLNDGAGVPVDAEPAQCVDC